MSEEGPESKKLKVGEGSSAGDGTIGESRVDVKEKEKDAHGDSQSEHHNLTVRRLVEADEESVVRMRRKDMIERRTSSAYIRFHAGDRFARHAAVEQWIEFRVKASDNVEGLLIDILRPTRILFLDDVELYFVASDENGPFSPCNELESLNSLHKEVNRLISSDEHVPEVLSRLRGAIEAWIKSTPGISSADYSGTVIYPGLNNVHDLFGWGLENTEEMNLRIADGPQVGTGLVASKPIGIGQTALSIPLTNLIDDKVYLGSPMHKEFKNAGEDDPREMLLLWCMLMRFGKQSNSGNEKYEVYFKSLPHEFRTGLTFGREALTAVEGTELGGTISSARMILEYRFQILEPIAARLHEFSGVFVLKNFIWACELLYTSGIEVHFSTGQRKICLIPLVPLFSRSLYPHILQCDRVEPGDRCLRFSVARPCPEGQECYLSCGNLSGASLVAFFGFLPKGKNRHDVVKIGITHSVETDEWPIQMLRASWFSTKEYFPEPLKSYLRKNFDDGTHELKTGMLASYLQFCLDELRYNDEEDNLSMMEAEWDTKLALSYQQHLLEILISAVVAVEEYPKAKH